MKIPAHINPNDHTRGAYAKRLDHQLAMQAINPKGFRQFRSGKRKNQRGKVHPLTRTEFLSSMVYG